MVFSVLEQISISTSIPCWIGYRIASRTHRNISFSAASVVEHSSFLSRANMLV